MRIFLSGNEDVCRWHLPVAQARAQEFVERCEKAGLKQNAFHFRFDDTGTSVQARYVFGQLSLQIHAPDGEEDPVKDKKKEIISQPIWIKEYDFSMRGSYKGRFFTQTEIIDIDYEGEIAAVTTVDIVNPSPGAILSSGMTEADVPNLSMHSIHYGLSSSSFVATLYYLKGDSYRYVSCKVIDGIVSGLAPSSFHSASLDELAWRFSGVPLHEPLDPEIRGSSVLSYSSGTFAVGAFHVSHPFFTLGVMTSLEDCKAEVARAIGAFGAPTDLSDRVANEIYDLTATAKLYTTTAPLMHPNGWSDSWESGKFGFVSKYMIGMYNIIGPATCHAYASNEDGPQGAYYSNWGVDWDGNPISANIWGVSIRFGGKIALTVNMIKADGTNVSSTIEVYNDDGYTSGSYEVRNWVNSGFASTSPSSNHRNFCSYTFAGFYIPSNFFALPRNYFHIQTNLTFIGDIYGYWFFRTSAIAYAYSDATSWKPCAGLTGIALYDEEAMSVLVGRIDSYANDYFGTFNWLRRIYNGSSFTWSNIFTFHSKKRISRPGYWGYPECRFVLNKGGNVLTIQNADYGVDGIYKLVSGVPVRIYEWDSGEIEAVYISDDGEIIATRKKIFVGADIVINCVHCCGVFFDRTHYVDWIGSDVFIIKNIETGAIVDTLSFLGHNFYEFSEDSSVCIISRYTLIPDDNTAPFAYVLDFADPVYRFEQSDQRIVQYIDSSIFYASESEQFGYPGGIPLGSRYVGVCECYRYSISRSVEHLKHYVYSPPPNGSTFCKLMSHCPMHNSQTNGLDTISSAVPVFTRSPSIVVEHSGAEEQRRDGRYGEIRLNKHLYHHTGKVLRRISDKLDPIDPVEIEMS